MCNSGKSFLKYISAFLISFLSFNSLFAQRYSIQKSDLSFVSNAELELIKASTSDAQGLIDATNNQFAFSVDVKTFKGFNSELQREHFNEKYLETEKYPKARFSGKIIEPIDFSQNATYDIRAKGELDIHGQKQTRIIKAKFIIKDGIVRVESRFAVPLDDHNITVPTIVRQKIATEISVEFNATLTSK
jgi:polyisoprenoid-binding protein YceI